jgi:hypothetical protein
MPTVIATSRSETHGFSKQPQPPSPSSPTKAYKATPTAARTTQHLYLKRKNAAAAQPLPGPSLRRRDARRARRQRLPPLQPGDLGENLLTRGLDLLHLPLGTQLTIGSDPAAAPILEVTGLRTPCSQIDTFRPGLQQHLWGPRDASGQRPRRAGIMATVQRGGLIHPNDPIQITLPPEPHQPLGPV